MAERVVGLISGTSVDGIDVAVAEFRVHGDELELRPVGDFEHPYPGHLRDGLLAALPPAAVGAGRLTELDTEVGQAFAEAAQRAVDRFGPAELISSLGQTVFHWVEDGRARGTLQLGRPAWIAERTGLPVIADLRSRDVAARGRVHDGLLRRLLAEPYYQAEPPKSTGRELFDSGYLDSATHGLQIGPEDLLATLTELTARTIGEACRRHGARTVVASGGGVDNPVLLRTLTARLEGARLVVSDELGLPGGAKEAYLTALLGWLTWHGVAADVPSATGARGPRLLGSITPGSGPLTLPAPRTRGITRLRVAGEGHWTVGETDAPR